MWLLAGTPRRRTGFIVLLQICLAVAMTGAEEEAKELVRMPISYERAMVVVVSSEGAAGVRFLDAFEIGNESGNGIVGTSYEWRYLERKPRAVEQRGTGRVFAKLVDGAIDHGSFIVTCGPMHMTWSFTDNATGTLQYDPREVAVHPVAAEYFADREQPIRTTAVDLSRFLDKDEAAIKEHRAELYSGPESEPHRYKADTAGPIPYKNTVLVVKDPSGVATFRFGKPFVRNETEDQKLYGLNYEFTFTSRNGSSHQAGTGEVYERCKIDKYDGGRLYLEAGPVHLAWSRGGNNLGWVYYDPAWMRVWSVVASDLESLTNAITVTDLFPESDKQ